MLFVIAGRVITIAITKVSGEKEREIEKELIPKLKQIRLRAINLVVAKEKSPMLLLQ